VVKRISALLVTGLALTPVALAAKGPNLHVVALDEHSGSVAPRIGGKLVVGRTMPEVTRDLGLPARTGRIGLERRLVYGRPFPRSTWLIDFARDKSGTLYAYSMLSLDQALNGSTGVPLLRPTFSGQALQDAIRRSLDEYDTVGWYVAQPFRCDPRALHANGFNLPKWQLCHGEFAHLDAKEKEHVFFGIYKGRRWLRVVVDRA
jgi:hypothetical protein